MTGTVETDKQEEMDKGDKSTASFCHMIGSIYMKMYSLKICCTILLKIMSFIKTEEVKA